MSTSNLFQRNQKPILIAAGIGLLASLLWLAQIFLAPSASSALTLDDQTLMEKALAYAKTQGLQEQPVATRAIRMTYGQWIAINGGQLSEGVTQFGINSDTTVFILAIRGNVKWRGLGLSREAQNSPEQFDNITIAIDARNGNLISAGATRSGFTMPIQVPLNALSPAPEITFVPTGQIRQAPTAPKLLPRLPASPTPKAYP
jgi:hypothetical protein